MQKMPLAVRPQVFDYMNAPFFLNDFYKWRKQSEPAFSFAAWALELGFGNKTLLRFMLQGKRNISKKSIEAFASHLKLSEPESRYFELLVNYGQAKTASQRNAVGQELMRSQRQRITYPQMPIESLDVLAEIAPVLIVLLSYRDVEFKIRDIEKLFNLRPPETDRLINHLVDLKIVERKNESLTSVNTAFKVADHYNNESLKKYYAHWMAKSVEALKLAPTERRYRSLLMALSQDEFEAFVGKINDFASSLMLQHQSNEITNKKLYMFNCALFPAVNVVMNSQLAPTI